MRPLESLRGKFALAVLCIALFSGGSGLGLQARAETDPLPSWNAGASKQAIVDFVTGATRPGPGFVEPEERIAVFDNDGTLWTEQPIYVQGFFVLDHVREMSKDHPEWQTTEPFRSALAGDLSGLAATGEKGLMELVAVTHAGMDQSVFDREVRDWTATAEHPRFHRRFTSLVYQPMLEVLDYLRASGFETWIVSGGGIDFMRPWTEAVYGIPPQQVVGSQIEIAFQMDWDVPRFIRKPSLFFLDDGPGKPVGILRHIGRQPVMAFGNSDGDFEMLSYVTGQTRPHLAMIVHHTDGKREYAYDRTSHVGRLDRALNAAPASGWVVIDMARDWSAIYPPEK